MKKLFFNSSYMGVQACKLLISLTVLSAYCQVGQAQGAWAEEVKSVTVDYVFNDGMSIPDARAVSRHEIDFLYRVKIKVLDSGELEFQMFEAYPQSFKMKELVRRKLNITSMSGASTSIESIIVFTEKNHKGFFLKTENGSFLNLEESLLDPELLTQFDLSMDQQVTRIIGRGIQYMAGAFGVIGAVGSFAALMNGFSTMDLVPIAVTGFVAGVYKVMGRFNGRTKTIHLAAKHVDYGFQKALEANLARTQAGGATCLSVVSSSN